jgi:hypothetical protein
MKRPFNDTRVTTLATLTKVGTARRLRPLVRLSRHSIILNQRAAVLEIAEKSTPSIAFNATSVKRLRARPNSIHAFWSPVFWQRDPMVDEKLFKKKRR